MSCHVFPGHRAWPSLQSLHFDATDQRLKRCLVAANIGGGGDGGSSSRVELSDLLFLEDAQRWSQAPLSLELQFSCSGDQRRQQRQMPVQDRTVCCPDGGALVQRRGAGFCQLLLLAGRQQQLRVKWQRRWDFDLGQMDVEFDSQLVYLPHYAKGVVHALTYPDMQPSQLLLCHQRLVTADRVVAKSRYVGVDGFVIDNTGATVPGLAVFDAGRSELLCAAALPEGLRKGWTFTVTNDGHLMLAECQVDRDTNRFRLFGYTRNGDLDFTVKLLAALHQPWRLQLVRDNLGRDFLQEEDSDTRLLVPVEAYLRKERLDSQRLATARELAMTTGFPQSI